MQKMKYTDMYIKKIKNGDIVVNKFIKKELRRINRFRNVINYEFDQTIPDLFIEFIESQMIQSKGRNVPLKLALVQKVWIENIFGWYILENEKLTNPETMEEYTKVIRHRLIHEVVIMLGRGSGKSVLIAALSLCSFILDALLKNENGTDVAIVSNSIDQARIVFDACKDLMKRPDSILYNYSHKKEGKNTIISWADNSKIIRFAPTGSSIKIKAADTNRLDGLNTAVNVFDEVHAFTKDVIDVVNKGSSNKRDDWVSIYITTNGTTRESVFDRKYKKWIDVLENDNDDSVMPFLYQLDNIEEIEDDTKWQKSLPLLGITPTKSKIHQQLISGKNDRPAMVEIMSKTFNMPMRDTYSFFEDKECKGNPELFNEKLFTKGEGQYMHNRAVLGIDLAAVNDIAAFSFLIKDRYTKKLHFKTLKILTRKSLENMGEKYQNKFIEANSKNELIISENNVIEDDYIMDILTNFINEHDIKLNGIGYDVWGASTLVQRLIKKYPETLDEKINVSKINQKGKEIAVGLNKYKVLLNDERMAFNDSLTSWCHSNVISKIKDGIDHPTKKQPNDKIDPFMAQLDAYLEYENHREFYDNTVFYE